MNNIFENAYFGKPYRTKDNTIVRFISQIREDYYLVYIPKCKYSIETENRYNSKGEYYLGNGEFGHSTLDIVSDGKISEEELNKLAYAFANNNELLDNFHISDNVDVDDLVIAYKAGFKEAEKIYEQYL